MKNEFPIKNERKKGAKGTLGVMMMASGGIGLLEAYSLFMTKTATGIFLLILFTIVHMGAIPVGFALKKEMKGFLRIGIGVAILLLLSRLGQILKKIPSVPQSAWSMGFLMLFLLFALIWEVGKERMAKK